MQFALFRRLWAQIPEAPAGRRSRGRGEDGGTACRRGRRGAAGVTSPPVPPCMLGAPRCPARAAGSRVFLSRSLPQNTALDKEGQILGSKLGADGGRPGLSPPPSRARRAPGAAPRGPGPAAPAPGSERAGTRRHHHGTDYSPRGPHAARPGARLGGP